MQRVAELWRRLMLLWRQDQFHRQLEEEMRYHLELKTQAHFQAGRSREEAGYAAQREFGNTLLLREESRDMWIFRRLDELGQDVRYGARMLAKNPGFTAVAVLTLALGIGANSTIFSVVSTMLLRKPPVHDPDQLMMLLSRNPASVFEANRSPVSPPDFLDWCAQATAFSEIAAASSFENADYVTLSGGTEPERVPSGEVSANYFHVLGVSPLLGRGFLPGEDQAGHDRVVVLRADLWKRRFGADWQVLGRTVEVKKSRRANVQVAIDADALRFRDVFMTALGVR